jgi:deoxyribodipyrimidine photo-lyase
MSSANLDSLGVPKHLQLFELGRSAALSRAARLQPSAYARTRNALDGAVSGLSPYLTHGVVGLADVIERVQTQHALDWSDKLAAEFAWRGFFHHVWAAQGDKIFSDLRKGAAGLLGYASELPADIREGRTGVPAIDAAVRVLYATGYLHNHARMWLASYCVHLRKVHWRAGADWMFAHLIDGDFASNHLSWQWVAGTFSSKPYLFNAENVAKYAPRHAFDAWNSAGSSIDQSYEALDAIARSSRKVGHELRAAGVMEPQVFTEPQSHWLHDLPRWDASAELPPDVHLVHPWALRRHAERADAIHLGIVLTDAHASDRERGLPMAWSERRWRWVLDHMARVCDAVWIGPLAALAPPPRALITYDATPVESYAQRLNRWRPEPDARLPAPTVPWPEPQRPCASFSKYFESVQRESQRAGWSFEQLKPQPKLL